MTSTLALRAGLTASIEADIAKRTKVHQSRVSALKGIRSRPALTAEADEQTPLSLLAIGDSWFDYPLDGNGPFPRDTDIIAHLRSMGAPAPLILNVSHFGDATTAELALPKQQRLVAALSDPANWLSGGRPDAILFSGGGNDIAGDRFCIYLDARPSESGGLDTTRVQGVLASIEASYLDLFSLRDQYAPGVPIFAHNYDFPIPNGVHPICSPSAWLRPSLLFRGWTDVDEGALIVRAGLSLFSDLLARLARAPANNFHLVETQGTLRPEDWANELHPYPQGFGAVAAKFVAALSTVLPGRI